MSNRSGYIYKIQNTINNKVYIGQTITNPMKRWQDHYSCYKKNIQYPLYQDMNQYGIEHFTFQVIESNVPQEQLDEKEIQYIQQYHSYIKDTGYNLTLGGQTAKDNKLKIEQVYEIIDMIQNNVEFNEIACIFDIHTSTVSDINCGDTWHFDDINYPVRISRNIKRHFTELELDDIYKKLRNRCSMTYIAKIYNVSVTTIANINSGKIYRKDNCTYPIYKATNSRFNLKQEQVKQVVTLLQSTNDTYQTIGRKLNIGRKTISNINKGLAYIEDLQALGYEPFPIRK